MQELIWQVRLTAKVECIGQPARASPPKIANTTIEIEGNMIVQWSEQNIVS